MKPILFDETAQTLTQIVASNTNGIGRINALTAVVTEERNGIYELEMNVFIDDEFFSSIHPGSIFKVKAGDFEGLQLFRVYQITKPINGICTVYARHITYDLGKAPVLPFSAIGIGNALNGLVSHLATPYEFGVYTDIQNVETGFQLDEPKYFRECLGGYSGSILDNFGGEYEFDNLTVKLLAHRGSDRGVEIRYGKNLTDLTQESNIESMYNAVLGFAVDDNGTATSGTIQYITQNTNAPKIKIVDFSDQFDDQTPITVNAINTLAQNYIQANSLNVPKVNIDVSLIALQQTDQYKDVLQLERVSLCDTVHVYFEKLGVNASAKVIRTEFDVLNERLVNVEIGDARTNLTESISESVADTAVSEAVSAMDGAIQHATDLITGGLGGYVVISKNANGQPEEILIMDTPDKATAVHVIRMNKNGIGFSSTGYSGTYTTAWTIDGGFVADFIKSGTINAININGSNITGSNIVFGDAPNTTTLRTNDAKTGALFDGNGVMQFNTKGEFFAKNVDSNSYIANQIRMRSNVLLNNVDTNQISFLNKRNDVVANEFYANAADASYDFWFYNNRPGVAKNANNHYMGATSSAYYNRLWNFAYNRLTSDNGVISANNLQLESTANYNFAGLRNYNHDGYLTNYVNCWSRWEANNTYNGIYIYNTDNSQIAANNITLLNNSSDNHVYIMNRIVGSSDTANEIQLEGNTSGYISYWVKNFDRENHKIANMIFLSSRPYAHLINGATIPANNSLNLVNYQNNANQIVNSKITMNDNLTFECQNRATFNFIGNGKQFAVINANNGICLAADGVAVDAFLVAGRVHIVAPNGLYVTDQNGLRTRQL